MCGIAGIVNLDKAAASPEILSAMGSALAHRGPDDSGFFTDRNIGLAHRRLSIIDLGGGHQPMSNEDGSVWIVFNGEIYNYYELRDTLSGRGHEFKTISDTETIVHLYEEDGVSFLTKLNGMFALAILDLRDRKIILARDRLGKKPLVWFRSGNVFAFASELQALKKHPSMPRELDRAAMHDYFSLQYIPAPATIYKGVCKLPPASVLELDTESGEMSVSRYWRIDFQDKVSGSRAAAAEKLRELLTDSVRKRMIADVPVGFLLSGGLDSAVTLGVAASAAEGRELSAFTARFDSALYDESDAARKTAETVRRRSGEEVKEFQKTVNCDDFDTVRKLVRHFGEPYSDASMLPACLVCAFAREHVTVALSGDGADELFGGYNRYQVMKLFRLAGILPQSGRKALSAALSKCLPPKTEERTLSGKLQRLCASLPLGGPERYFRLINRFDEELKASLRGPAWDGDTIRDSQFFFNEVFADCGATDFTEKFMEADIMSYLPGDILPKMDIASMLNSLEVRSPFLDYRVAEFAASLPPEWKLHGLSRKHIVKEAFLDMVHPDVLRAGKKGFGVPLAQWFRGGWNSIWKEHVLGGGAVKLGLINNDAAERLITAHEKNLADNSYVLWSLLILELFLDSE
jgi:asparagine synthase (glutamine-hydrolysing)